jgi:hypothetical protein
MTEGAIDEDAADGEAIAGKPIPPECHRPNTALICWPRNMSQHFPKGIFDDYYDKTKAKD